MWLLNKFLTKVIRSGELVLDGPTKTYRYGSPREGHAPIHIAIKDKATTAKIARNPALGGGEAFMAGKLVIENDDIMSFLGLIAYNMRWDYSNETRVSLWKTQRLLSKFQQLNDAITSRKNVAHHYDLNDRLYDLFLDADRQYSCAYFTDDDGNSNDELGHDELDRAQKDKLAHIAAKLCLKPEHHVLDIGCGWGGLALYLNKVSGARVTGITLSVEQLKVARERAEAAGVSDRVKFELIDYRALEGRFDRVVSVGMFEHVGRPNYQTYFDCIRDFLVEDGIALVHTIARADGPGVTDPWTAKYIFPGGYAPAISEIMPHVEKSWMWATDIEVLRLHYGRTLKHWYERCEAKRAEIEAIYDEDFYRMWMFYLAAAANAFFHDGHMNVQVQLSRKRDAVPLTRDYIAEAEGEYRKIG